MKSITLISGTMTFCQNGTTRSTASLRHSVCGIKCLSMPLTTTSEHRTSMLWCSTQTIHSPNRFHVDHEQSFDKMSPRLNCNSHCLWLCAYCWANVLFVYCIIALMYDVDFGRSYSTYIHCIQAGWQSSTQSVYLHIEVCFTAITVSLRHWVHGLTYTILSIH